MIDLKLIFPKNVGLAFSDLYTNIWVVNMSLYANLFKKNPTGNQDSFSKVKILLFFNVKELN